MTLLAYTLLALAVILAVLVLGMALTQPAGASSPTGTLAGSSAPTGAEQAPLEQRTEYRDWALHWREQAVRVRARALKHTRALGIKPPRAIPKMQRFIDPATGEEFVDWFDYGQALKHQTKHWREYAIPRWHERLTHPRGSGAARWWPLARFVGWPLSQKANVIYCIWAESRGNPSDGPCLGILQIHPCHAVAYRRVTGHSVWEYTNSRANLTFGLWLWERSGWGPWVTM